MNAISRIDAFVEETGFGHWFLRSGTWKVHVLCRALNDLQRLMPMDVQHTAPKYVAMIRQADFALAEARISTPYLWWSRPDIGFLEWIGVPVPKQREETLVNAVAVKP